MELQPASITQVLKGRGGREITLDAGSDVLDVVRRIKAISPALSVHWNDQGEYFAVKEDVNGKQETVLTTNELDQRVIGRLLLIASESYSYTEDIERLDNQAERDKDARFSEQIGERGERLAHALRKDLQVQSHIYLPKGV